jgi:hypothetical protein
MDKNKYSVEEPDNTDKGSDGELFVTRVSSSGVVLKFKARKNGTFPSSSNVLTHELTFSEKGNASGLLEYIEANCNQSMWVQSSEIRNAEPRDNNISFHDSTMGTSNQDEISKVEMVNNSSKEFDQMVSLKSAAMETSMAGTNEINSSQNVTDGIRYRGNHEASASQKTLSCPNEVHICHQCDKRFESIDSLNGHMSCHRRVEYNLIRAIINPPLVTNTSMIDMPEVKQIWIASQALINGPMLSGKHRPMHSTKAISVTGSTKDISGDTIQMMEVADLLIKLSQKEENVVKVPSSPSVRVLMCRTCNKIFDSYHALGGHRSIHNKPKQTHHLVNTATSSSGSGELQNLKFRCCKCNERFLTGQSLGGHKRKHWFEEQKITTTDRALLLVNDELRSTEKDLRGVEGSVCMQVPRTYEAAQTLQTNSPGQNEELSSGVDAIVADVESELPSFGRTLLPKANDKEL